MEYFGWIHFCIGNFFKKSVAYFANLWNTYKGQIASQTLIKHGNYVSSYLLSCMSSNKSSLRTCWRKFQQMHKRGISSFTENFHLKLNIKFWINLPEQIMYLRFLHSQNLTTFSRFVTMETCDAGAGMRIYRDQEKTTHGVKFFSPHHHTAV